MPLRDPLLNSIRHAPYAEAAPDFAIGLRAIGAAEWLEGGEPDCAARKDALWASARPLVWGEMESSRAGQAEVVALVEAAGVPVLQAADLPPLWRAARAVPDDLVLMEKRDGVWRLAAISLCAGAFFTADQVLGLSLAELHGPVPGFDERFLRRVERIFDGLREGLVLERRNWTVVATEALHAPRRPAAEVAPDAAGAALFVRVERQTVRRLPSGVLFTIRVWRHPLGLLAQDPARLAAFAHAWRNAPADFRLYKQLHLLDAPVEAFLRASGE